MQRGSGRAVAVAIPALILYPISWVGFEADEVPEAGGQGCHVVFATAFAPIAVTAGPRMEAAATDIDFSRQLPSYRAEPQLLGGTSL